MPFKRHLRWSRPGSQGRRLGLAVRLTLLAAVALSLHACSSGDDGGDGASTTPSTAANGSGSSIAGGTTTASLAPPAGAELGRETTIAGWKITVDAVGSTAEVDGAKASAGEELLVVRFTVVNTLSRPVSLTAEDLSVKGDGASTYRAIDTKTGLFALAPVPAGGTASSFVVFAVPTGAKSLKLHFSPFIEGNISPREADITLKSLK
ncbi:MAG: DUF4352 domain-containing protein [bacterium]